MDCDHLDELNRAASLVLRAARNLNMRHGGKEFTAQEFQDEIIQISDYKRGSIIPSDYCYNLIN